MKIVKPTLKNIKMSADIVAKGGLVVYPTDTVYGLGCDPFNLPAVKRLIQVKGSQARSKPLPVLSSSLESVKRIAHVSSEATSIARKFWPGPLTLILRKKLLSDVLTFGHSTVGVRIPNHKVALKLLELSGGLLVGTSANKTGLPPPTSVVEVKEQLRRDVDIILDGGPANLGISSTVIDLTLEELRVVRRGAVSVEETRFDAGM